MKKLKLLCLGICIAGGCCFGTEPVEKVVLGEAVSSGTNSPQGNSGEVTKYIDDVRGKKGWWSSQSEHFVMVSDQYDSKFGAQLLIKIEKVRRMLMGIYPPSKEFKDLVYIKLFKNKADYKEYTSKPNRKIQIKEQYDYKSFDLDRSEMVFGPCASDGLSEKDLKESFEGDLFAYYSTMYFYANRNVYYNSWFLSGNAGFFTHTTFNGAKTNVKFSQDNHMGETVKEVMDADLKAAISKDESSFVFTYMVYYMLKGAPATGKPQYAEIPRKYFKTICEGGSVKEADSAAWKNVDMPVFEKDFKLFWKGWKSNLIKADGTALNK